MECKYLVRLLLGKNRLGVQRKSVLAALSEYACYKTLLARGKLPKYDPAKAAEAATAEKGSKGAKNAKSGKTPIVAYVQRCWDAVSAMEVTSRVVDAADDEGSASEASGEDFGDNVGEN